jgi:hypothetical protein
MIRNYENPEGTISLIDSTSVSVPVKVFTSSTTGAAVGGAVTGKINAITTISLCNTGTPDITNESVDSVTVNIYLVRSGKSYTAGNLIVSNLTIPAGETVFFNEERVVLNPGDEIWVGTSAASLLAVTVSALQV